MKVALPKKSLFFLILFSVVFYACKTSASQEPAPVPVRVLILGNSITHNGPLPDMGWNGDWGMAASSPDKDYVHVLVDSLREYHSKTLDFKEHNISFWERNFDFDFYANGNYNEWLNYKPDILIFRLGENVEEGYARSNAYDSAFAKLVRKFKTPDSHVIITGNFWPSEYKDSIQKEVALKFGYAYVDLSDLHKDVNNFARKEFTGGIGEHPSDKGMAIIADRIFRRIVEEKWLLKKGN